MFESDNEASDWFLIRYDDPLAGVDGAMRTWAAAQVNYRPGAGYARTCSTCRDATSSVQYESEEEVIEDRQRGLVIDAVSGAMDSLSDPLERAVLWQVYANTVGPAVWRNGRLKALGRGDVKALHRSALMTIGRMLRRRGVAV